MDLIVVISIITAAIAGIKWSDKEARKWVRLIEMIHEDDRRERENQKKEGDTNGEKDS